MKMLFKSGGLFLLSSSLLGVTFEVPHEFATAEGNAFSSIFNRSPIHYQQVYASDQFGLIQAGGGILLNVYFRLDSPLGSPFFAELPEFEMRFSTTQMNPDGLSSVFSENVGPDETLVFGSGPVEISAGHAPFGSPQPWLIEFRLPTQFYYDPNAGNLLMDLTILAPDADVPPFDAVDALGDGVSNLRRSGESPPVLETKGLVTRFQFEAVPEPSSLRLLLTSFLTLIGWRLFRKGLSTRENSTPCR
jgi:hypothetical protein